jgi:integrase
MAHYTTCSRQWLALKESTRGGYRPYHLLISTVLGRHRVAKTAPATIEALIQKKEFGTKGHSEPAPGAARQLRTTFGLLCEHARRQLKWISVNPIPDIDKPRPKNKQGWHTWSESQVNAWRLAFPDPASDARCFLEMGLAWGARAGDLCRLGFKDIEDGVLSFTPEKTETSTGAEVNLPVKGQHLLAVLAHRSQTQRYFFQQPPRGSNQYTGDKLVALKPAPWSYTRLRKSFVEWRAAAGLPDMGDDRCVIHGLRKLFATRMSNAGVSLQDIADALGDTEESAKIYIARRDKRKGAARGVNAVSEAA